MAKDSIQAKLAENQNEKFDAEYVAPEYWAWLVNQLQAKLGVESVRIGIDVGGGNGCFADHLLNLFPNAQIYNIDLSKSLLAKNQPHERKVLIEGSFLDFTSDAQIDLVSINWVLHHMVGRSFRASDKLIRDVLSKASSLLSDKGYLVVFENIIQGHVSDHLSSWLLYKGTSSRFLRPLTRKLGANTAGVGIYYMGRENLLKKFAAANLELVGELTGHPHDYGWKLLPILSREVRERCFVLRKRGISTPPGLAV